jgi:hypothetical protein
MNKKRAILLIIGFEVIIYIFILLIMPLFLNSDWFCPTCDSRYVFTLPMQIASFIPLLIGAMLLILTLRGKETKDE